MKKRKLLIRTLTVLVLVTAVATVTAYFILNREKPWMAFYVVCCGGLLVFNFLVSLFLVHKNFKDK